LQEDWRFDSRDDDEGGDDGEELHLGRHGGRPCLGEEGPVFRPATAFAIAQSTSCIPGFANMGPYTDFLRPLNCSKR
jgi:hypothetical protein